MFDPVDPKQQLSALEEGILQYWKEEDTFKRSIRQRDTSEGDPWDKQAENGKRKEEKDTEFSFYDGPPFATGLPHYGHILAGTEKDVIPRYQTMRGKKVQRRFGWDCHGLPIETLIEKEHNITDKKQIEEMGTAAFNDLCRGSVQRYTKEWRDTVDRMGRWVDMDWDYKTMNPEYMESIWWVFSKLYRDNLIYEGLKPMHICPRCATPLSNFEVTQGYNDRTDLSVIMTFPLKDDPSTVVLAWTTTPWSLPGNTWLAVSSSINYVKVQEGDITYIVAEKLVEKVFKNREYELVGSIEAKELIGKRYDPLFEYHKDRIVPRTEATDKPETYGERVYKIVEYDDVEVTDEDGTGIVHITSCLGGDSYAVAVHEDVDVIYHVGMDGMFDEVIEELRGVHVKPEGEDPMSTDKIIIQMLKDRGRYFSSHTYTHSYPHCWRCDTPLLPYTTSSWFVSVDTIKDKMLAANAKTHWVPQYVRDGRFQKWLENARDWAISRNRYWGTPLPIWKAGNDAEVVGSRDDLMSKCLIRFGKITVLRHAESEGNLIPIYQGEEPGTDLTQKGQKQAEHAGTYLSKDNHPVQLIYCSPLARTRQTAEKIAKETGAEVVVDERLREVRFGDYEGKTIDFSDLSFLKTRRAQKIESGKPESIYHFDGMETWDSVASRITEFLEETLPKHRSEHIVIVTHADPVINIEHFFTGEDPVKLSHRPYPEKAVPTTYFWDHKTQKQMDLHLETVEDVSWNGARTDQSVDLTLVRHGETDWNEQGIAQGHEDRELNDTGRAQAEAFAKTIKKDEYDCIVTSDLKRAAQTAQILSDATGIPIEGTWEELRERHQGEWQGKVKAELLEKVPCRGSNRKSLNFHYNTPKGGESMTEFVERAERACTRLQEEFPGKKVLVVSHGGTEKAIRIVAENLSYPFALNAQPGNADAGTVVELNPRFTCIGDVLDCWFESGSMPYAQDHYPFEMAHDGSKLPPNFPADFIAENLDQTRGWFYTLIVLSAALFDEPAFQNCICGGIILAEDGKKMSKRLKNYPDPMEVMGKYGADAMRFTLMSSPVVRAETLRFSEKGVQETMQRVLLPLWNTYSFFVTYANAAKFEPVDSRRHSTHPLDVWIRSEVQDLVNRMTEQLDGYDLSGTCNELHETIDALTNWYVRLSRRRFAGKGAIDGPDATGDKEEQDQHDALMTLYDVLITFSQLLAPFCPFITEAMYLNLVAEDHGSIHLTDWPEPRELKPNEKELLEKTRLMRQIVSLGNSIRAESKVRIRQPLSVATIAIASHGLNDDDLALLRQELNVKEVAFADDPEQLATRIAMVDARKVGPRLGKRVQEIINAGKEGDFTENDDGTVLILDEVLQPNEVAISYRGKEGESVAADRGVVVSIETEVTEDLKLEGEARDIIRGVQRVRKETGLEFTDQIKLSVSGADDVLATFEELICQETRATIADNSGDKHDIEMGDSKVTVQFEKV